MGDDDAAYLNQTGVQQDAGGERIQDTRHSIFRGTVVIVSGSCTITSSNTNGSVNGGDK